MILGAYALLHKNPKPTRAQIIAHMEDHICRCGAHVRIVAGHRRPLRRRGEGRCAMTRHDADMEVPSGWGFVTTVDRREFLKLTSTGLLVAVTVDPLFGRQEPHAAADGPDRLPRPTSTRTCTSARTAA